jgi:hypothetical protein
MEVYHKQIKSLAKNIIESLISTFVDKNLK